jgi:hypothetical protein
VIAIFISEIPVEHEWSAGWFKEMQTADGLSVKRAGYEIVHLSTITVDNSVENSRSAVPEGKRFLALLVVA